jgi:NADH-quinone oxidoreductase subunit E
MSTAEGNGNLLPEEIAAIRRLAAEYPDPRAACVEALKLVQSRHRWICDGRLAEVAGLLGMTADELDGIATFYNLIFRRPVGRHVVLLCDSVSCWVMGQEKLLEHLRQRLGIGFGATTADGRFTLLPTVCLGFCDHAPAAMVGEEQHGDLDPQRLDAVLESCR